MAIHIQTFFHSIVCAGLLHHRCCKRIRRRLNNSNCYPLPATIHVYNEQATRLSPFLIIRSLLFIKIYFPTLDYYFICEVIECGCCCDSKWFFKRYAQFSPIRRVIKWRFMQSIQIGSRMLGIGSWGGVPACAEFIHIHIVYTRGVDKTHAHTCKTG